MKLSSRPTERAPAILIFGPLADRVAGLLRSRPSLTARITFAPREAIHAIAAFLYLAPEAADTVAEVANLVDTSDPRGLLAKAIPDCPARLYRALDTAGNKVQPHSFYQRLSSACRGPFGTELLNGKLSDERLGFYEAIQTMDPLVANLRTAMPETKHVAEAVSTLITMICSYGALGECDMTLPKNARTNAVLRRLMRGVDAIRAPAPPFTPPSSLRFVGSVGELRQIARKFGNCLTRLDHYAMKLWFGLADGSMVFLVHDELCFLVALRQVGRNVWHIEEVNGVIAGKAVEAALKEAGVNLVTMDPLQALWKLQEIAKRRPTGHDEFGDVSDGELAAVAVSVADPVYEHG